MLAVAGTALCNARAEVGPSSFIADAFNCDGGTAIQNLEVVNCSFDSVGNGVKAMSNLVTGRQDIWKNRFARDYMDLISVGQAHQDCKTSILLKSGTTPSARSGIAENLTGDARDPHGDLHQSYCNPKPGLRSVDTGWQVLRALDLLRPRLTVENRLQLRWETFCPEAEPLIRHALSGPDRPALAFNDHTSMALLHPATTLQDRPFDLAPDYPVTDPDAPGFLARMTDRAKRAQMSVPDYVALLMQVWQCRPEVPQSITRIADLARAAGVPMASHDDSQTETRRFFRAQGATIAEFPMHDRVFAEARAAGDWIVLGAPNAMRGGSHLQSPGAAGMIRRGLCDILASDYFYPAMPGAVTRLLADGLGDLPALWPLVAANPAAAMGLADRGRIAPGLRADLVLLDWPDQSMPAPLRTWAAGRGGYSTLPTARG